MLDKSIPATDAQPGTGPHAPGTLAVLIVGMHRSGTSALSGVLNKMGVAVPEDLHPADEHNARGYFEPRRIIDFHEALLARLGSPSDDPLPLSDDWMASPVGQAAVSELAGILDEEFGDNPLCLFKDPRLCRLAPLWIQALAAGGRGAVAILPCRRPLEVAGSLGAKGGIPRGYALMWWLQHVVQAEQSTRGLARSFTLYDELMEDWRPVVDRVGAELGLAWPRDALRAGPEIDAFLSGELRHHKSAADALSDEGLDRLCARAWAAMEAFARDPYDSRAQAEIDDIRVELDRGLGTYGPVVTSYQHKFRELQDATRRTFDDAQELVRLSQDQARTIEEQQAAFAEQAAAIRKRDHDIGRLHRARLDADARIVAVERRLAKREAALADAEELVRHHSWRAHEAAVSLQAIQASPFWRITGPVRRTLERHPGLRVAGRRAVKLAWWTATLQLGRRLDERARRLQGIESPEPAPAAEAAAPEPQPAPPRLRIVFVSGEADTPGHLYRIERYAEAARAIGAEAVVLRIEEAPDRLDVFADADLAIVWRAVWTDKVAAVVEAIKAHGVPLVFDVDDLMFEPEFATTGLIDGIRTQSLEEADVRDFYGRVQGTFAHADYGSAPTPFLAQRMRLYERPSFVLPNGFDDEVLTRSRLEARRRRAEPSDGLVRIGYATGSKTHQKDFGQAVAALARVLRQRPQARLVLFKTQWGPVMEAYEFPELDGLHDQIEWRDLVPIQDLPSELARFDISIAPLEVGNPFCEAKSELKFFEAALVDVPTVASPAEPFRLAIRHGENGFLASTQDEWFDALVRLVDDAGLRRRMAAAALYDALADFGPERRAELFLSMVEQILPDARRAARAFELDVGRRMRPRPGPPHVPPHEVVFAADRLGSAEATVIIPLYNYRDYVVEALESVKAQTVGELDLVVVNDASTDDSEAVALAWIEANASRFNRVVLVRNTPNAGLGFSRNVGFANAETPFVLPLDADNRLAPSFVEKAVAAIEASGAAFAYPLIQQFGDDSFLMGQQGWNPGRLVTGNFIDAMALIRRSAWASVGGYDHVRFGWEDYDFWLRCVGRGHFGVQIREALAEYRVHGASMLRSETEIHRNKTKLLNDMARRHPWIRLEPLPNPNAPAGTVPRPVVAANPAARLERLTPILRDPISGERLVVDGELIRAVGSDRTWPVLHGRPILFEGLGEPRVFPDEHISNALPDRAIELIEKTDGLVLNLSAGGSDRRFDHVIEAEFAVFRHTDVVADAHALPFADESFDLVVSMNAFEHYHTPPKASAEILRVLKPGGRVLIRTAFLQPLHEAPFHFYNCTRYGLERWFEAFATEDLQVSENFNPVYALTWQMSEAEAILRRGLGDAEAERLLDARGRDLVELWRNGEARGGELWKSFHKLPQGLQEGLAAGFEYLGRKPG